MLRSSPLCKIVSAQQSQWSMNLSYNTHFWICQKSQMIWLFWLAIHYHCHRKLVCSNNIRSSRRTFVSSRSYQNASGSSLWMPDSWFWFNARVVWIKSISHLQEIWLPFLEMTSNRSSSEQTPTNMHIDLVVTIIVMITISNLVNWSRKLFVLRISPLCTFWNRWNYDG